MKICLVATFPPSGRQLNEYAFHIAKELKKHEDVELIILADELTSYDFATDANGESLKVDPHAELPGFKVIRCWKFGAISTPWRLLATIRKLSPDVVWFNLASRALRHLRILSLRSLDLARRHWFAQRAITRTLRCTTLLSTWILPQRAFAASVFIAWAPMSRHVHSCAQTQFLCCSLVTVRRWSRNTQRIMSFSARTAHLPPHLRRLTSANGVIRINAYSP